MKFDKAGGILNYIFHLLWFLSERTFFFNFSKRPLRRTKINLDHKIGIMELESCDYKSHFQHKQWHILVIFELDKNKFGGVLE